jgi:hypothetical protein
MIGLLECVDEIVKLPRYEIGGLVDVYNCSLLPTMVRRAKNLSETGERWREDLPAARAD